jgi:hypothetical protein
MASGKAIRIRRRIVRLPWGVARIVWFVIATIFTRRISVRKLAGLVPANLRRTCMSETVKLAQRSVKGSIERVNGRGIKLGETWYDYEPGFKGERLDKESVGQEVELALVESTKEKGNLLIRALEVCGTILGETGDDGETPEPEAEESATQSEAQDANPSDAPASEKTLKCAKDLAEKAGLSEEDVENILQARFHKSFDDLTQGEASRTIVFFGGYTPDRGRSSNQQ